MESVRRQRLDFIDVAKALGIIAVMLSHSVGFPLGTGYYFAASYMALFFVLSGYTYNSGRSAKDNFKRRTVKIGKAYFFYSICLYIMSVGSKIVLHSGITKEYLLTGVGGVLYSTNTLYYPRTIEPNISFFLVQNAPLWYLTCFIIAGALFDLVSRFLKSGRGVIGIIIGGTVITYLLAYIPIRLPWGIDTAFAGMAFMAFGYWLNEKKVLEKIGKWYFAALGLILYVGLCLYNPGIAMSVREYGDRGVISVILFVVIGCIGAVLYILLAKLLCKLRTLKQALCIIGQRTLTILAFHVFIFVMLDTVIEKLPIVRTLSEGILYWPIGVLKIGVAVAICLVGGKMYDNFRRCRNIK